MSPNPAPLEELVLGYLSQGVLCGIYNDKGMLFDVFPPKRRIEGVQLVGKTGENRPIQPNLILTDGTWLWPGALLYYIKEYHLQLPSTFLHHAERQSWQIDPATVQVEELNWDSFDGVPPADENAG
jgi:hypothetical protein